MMMGWNSKLLELCHKKKLKKKLKRKINKRLKDLTRYAVRYIRPGGECKNDSRNIGRESRND